MPSSDSTQRTRTISEARQELSDIVTAACDRSKPTVITSGRKPVAAVVPLEDLEAMEVLEDMMDLKVAKQHLKSFRKQGGKTLETFRQELNEGQSEDD